MRQFEPHPRQVAFHAPKAASSKADGRYYLVVDLPGLPKTPNARLHYWGLAKERKTWKDLVWLTCRNDRPASPLDRARVRLTRFSSVCPDHDNLVAGFKPCLDGLVAGGILTDDKWSNIGMPEYAWEHAPAKAGHVRLEVWSIAP